MTNFDEVIEYVVTTFKNTSIIFDEAKIKGFLEELKIRFHGQRLLMNIAIDLKFKNVEIQTYLNYLNIVTLGTEPTSEQKFDKENPYNKLGTAKAARKIHQSQNYFNTTNARKFYNNVVLREDVISNSDLKFRLKTDFDSKNKWHSDGIYTFKNKKLPRKNGGMVWLTDESSFIHMINVPDDKKAINVCNKLGLTFPELKVKTNELEGTLITFKLPEKTVEITFIPNAFCNSYSDDGYYPHYEDNGFYGLFMSNNHINGDSNWGQTFVRSGMNIGDNGTNERVCETVELNDKVEAFLLGELTVLSEPDVTNFIKIAFNRLNQTP